MELLSGSISVACPRHWLPRIVVIGGLDAGGFLADTVTATVVQIPPDVLLDVSSGLD